VMMHGCGLSAMSWALVAALVKKEYNVVAFDFRGHGQSKFDHSDDLSADTLVNDTIQLLNTLYNDSPTSPSIILVGHSMGGAIATRVAASGKVKGIVGLAVVDVVEGTALAALGSMQGIIASRPAFFSSVHKAIEWGVSSNTVRNLESARVSIPAQLVFREEDGKWVWRTDLARTEEHWTGWFTDLSHLFLQARAARLLLLAGCDRLDRPLTVGQMQGKFQLVVLPAVGHLVQEDSPEATASALVAFANRYGQSIPLWSIETNAFFFFILLFSLEINLASL
jgi:protein phosphatase methylesterase 1